MCVLVLYVYLLFQMTYERMSSICLLIVSDDVRAYGFVRLNTGDELSKRSKFALVTFVGANVGALKRARMSTDKAEVKSVMSVSN